MNRRDALRLGAGAVTLPVLAQTAAWTPQVFDAHQNETVVALTELIIPATDTPGAKAALVNRYIDLLLADGPAPQREAFLSGLAWLDGYAMKQHSKPFVRCTAAEQTAMLETLDAARGGDLATGARFFRMAKGMTARIYYSTQIGFDELNKGGRVPATFGCRHPEHA
ncbi:MAG: gluconate 2-dehydrogenase subunit 3 family protein [Bryobacteraceae bacterium]|nr:gluconate 2-dehydrogenase subunit 3 family protein [Bryobacteraceae bacterium]